jgi:flagellar basal body rod protein FlgG
VNISLFQAASALNANSRWQEAIAENMAASSVPGYKSQFVSFKAVQAGMMPVGATSGADRTAWSMPQGTTATSFAQGEMKYTGSPTDVGIQGNGFFEVQKPDGSLAYTRDGEFKINAAGHLVTKSGYTVMSDSGPLQLDHATSDPITISSDGTVSQGPNVRGTLKIVSFTKPELLTPQGGGVYVVKDPNVELSTGSALTVRQFYLEQANTNSVTEMANLITVMRSSEANQRVIQMQDERMGKAITELGNPS